ncbi:Stp1/IreP family PP2C-type Ser/Thr phosphatase [Lactobacillus acetotolerans]|uniref:Stp1/IreP family PP2C-type Ser/Thr phosphatase n=2 Tax=Lactobacillus acetotolerans TaxID=1600 RepID=A0A356VPT8_9LACO|nr:Stp1/IreP family PP2C-type Ser/Thr phosphatase [Lactobacillus acetotolerans]KRN41923.1 serine threonine protein phosphatase 1 [Lactobacillus acetotolerans DSM 20749 = JCM 3825]MBN7275926.1 Stp1/IreP family PP2C-type Ser/Thr phosphatase [Lactobacillus acetotolerans]QFG51107.1 Stp1/IreP family PP2C-type Ser/Thr phosphatase [Lactobacillus acetotolerans]QGV04788.1 Stp1/IreP family PP2C-type Ser/Thr phosphatase [Lactobacillus acetotolerans]QJD73688.1 Stp1/IreP family PP2C-type Ser/Thr phosphatas
MIETAFASSIGRIRKSNQDFVQVFKNKSGVTLAIVCDGMGGHQGGDVASAMAVSHLGHNFKNTDFSDSKIAHKWLEVQLNSENETILKTADRFPDLNGMGTTIVLTIVFDTTALIAHLGDSRAYSYADGKFTQLVEDHSLVNELVKMGQITKEQAKHHPQKNIITQALGVSSTIDPEFREIKLHDDDIIMLCTDGLTNSLTDPQIQQILATKDLSLKDRCNKLINEANRLGGGDNITVCLVSSKGDDDK